MVRSTPIVGKEKRYEHRNMMTLDHMLVPRDFHFPTISGDPGNEDALTVALWLLSCLEA